jgi:hypothetical protein
MPHTVLLPAFTCTLDASDIQAEVVNAAGELLEISPRRSGQVGSLFVLRCLNQLNKPHTCSLTLGSPL